MSKAKLATVVGSSCAALLLVYVPSFEGVILRGYKDPIGIVTACAGHTATAVLGRPYTKDECDKLLDEDLSKHAGNVLRCAPSLKGKTGPLAASVSMDFNTGRFCGSTMQRKLEAGDIAGGCAELSKWVYAGGKVFPGLVKRRAAEQAICEGRPS